MKTIAFLLFIPTLSLAQGRVESKAYNWPDFEPVKDENRIRRQYLDGSTTLLDNLEIHTSTVDGGEAPHPPHTHEDQEELVIIKEGTLTATVGKESRVLGPGGVIYVLPGEEHGFVNAGKAPCTYFIIKLKDGSQLERSAEARSFMMDWSEMKFVPHDKGGRRNVVDGPTSMFTRFEMHITTLNPGLTSHAPHTHTPEEIILIKEGDVEMNVGEKKVKASQGGLVFLESGIEHNLTNIGGSPATYFAFQWGTK
jgi:(S)-ureidoglycine aminohydrolase